MRHAYSMLLDNPLEIWVPLEGRDKWIELLTEVNQCYVITWEERPKEGLRGCTKYDITCHDTRFALAYFTIGQKWFEHMKPLYNNLPAL